MTTMKIKFVPIKHDGRVDLGKSSIPGRQTQLFLQPPHVYLGFKPSPGKTRSGWLVFAYNPAKPGKPKRKL